MLVHGWGGAASQLSGFVDPLVRAGYRVMAFDLPGHGGSSGRWTHLVEVGEIVTALAPAEGLAGIVAHSLGAAAVGVALGDGLEVPRVAVIGAAVEPGRYWRAFMKRLDLSPRAVERAHDELARRVGRTLPEVSMKHSLARRSLPTMIVHDEHDRWASVDDARTLAHTLPQGHLHLTRGLGHSRLLADPDTIAFVCAFLSGHPVALADRCRTPGCEQPVDPDAAPHDPRCLECLVYRDLVYPR
jgi:pimeloyl-ACP methyl ester carboxylesterase